MFARIMTLAFRPDTAESGFDIVQHSIAPSIREQGGCRGMVLLRDPQTGSATLVTFWDTQADMEATVTGNFPTQLAKVSKLLDLPPVRRVYEVKDSTLPFPSGPPPA